jgi:hypothetical protein
MKAIAILLLLASPALGVMTHQERGSLMNLGVPARTWVAVPTNGLDRRERLSVIYFGSVGLAPSFTVPQIIIGL